MARSQLNVLRRIQGNLEGISRDKNALKEDLKDFFQSYLDSGRKAFQKRLNTAAVSDNFDNTVASRRLASSFNTDLGKSLQFGSDGTVKFKFFIKSSGRRNNSDPAEYFDAIDDASHRRKGPNLERVIEWLKERKILQKTKKGRYRKTVNTPGGKRPSIEKFARVVQRAIWKKTRNREYKSLHLSALFADIIDIKNPNSPFRQTMLERVSDIVLKPRRSA